MRSEIIIELKNVSKSYYDSGQTRRIFENLNCVVNAREFLVLLGRSGSGKSTLLNLIGGIDLPDQGSIIVDGTDITALTETERTLFRRHHIGFVFQFFNLIPTLTVEENLLLPLELIGTVTKKERERVHDLLERLKLTNREESYPDRLSGGEQQRVAIARSLIHDPTFVLADEPTGNLDLETGLAVLNVLNELVTEYDKTLVMVTHSQEVIGFANRVLSIHQGTLQDHSKSA